jgi:uncharacterized protein (UPF0335 family)
MARRDEDLVGDDDGEEARGGDGRRVKKTDNVSDDLHKESSNRLRSFIERIERLEEEKATIADDIKDVFAEAKGEGYDTKAIRTILKIRKKDASERAEEESVLNTYLMALGMRLLGDDD